MGLTSGTGPFGHQPAGRFNFTPETPTGAALYFDPVPYRLRGFFAGEAAFDTTRAKLLYETAHLPVYYVPEDDLRHDLLEPSETRTRCPHKGVASYRTLRVGDRFETDAVFAQALLRRRRRCPRHESNMRTRFRKPLLYPLSYGGRGTLCPRAAPPPRSPDRALGFRIEEVQPFEVDRDPEWLA